MDFSAHLLFRPFLKNISIQRQDVLRLGIDNRGAFSSNIPYLSIWRPILFPKKFYTSSPALPAPPSSLA